MTRGRPLITMSEMERKHNKEGYVPPRCVETMMGMTWRRGLCSLCPSASHQDGNGHATSKMEQRHDEEGACPSSSSLRWNEDDTTWRDMPLCIASKWQWHNKEGTCPSALHRDGNDTTRRGICPSSSRRDDNNMTRRGHAPPCHIEMGTTRQGGVYPPRHVKIATTWWERVRPLLATSRGQWKQKLRTRLRAQWHCPCPCPCPHYCPSRHMFSLSCCCLVACQSRRWWWVGAVDGESVGGVAGHDWHITPIKPAAWVWVCQRWWIANLYPCLWLPVTLPSYSPVWLWFFSSFVTRLPNTTIDTGINPCLFSLFFSFLFWDFILF